jgi:acyl-CoA thioester hydrolase
VSEAGDRRSFEVILRIPVRTYDIDFAGIVSNIVYIRWLEDLRSTMLEQHMPLDRYLHEGKTPVLLSTDIRYLRAVRLFQQVTGRMWLSQVGRVRWTLQAEIEADGVTAAVATQTCAVVSLPDFKSQPVPDILREGFLKT